MNDIDKYLNMHPLIFFQKFIKTATKLFKKKIVVFLLKNTSYVNGEIMQKVFVVFQFSTIVIPKILCYI